MVNVPDRIFLKYYALTITDWDAYQSVIRYI